MLAAVCIGAYLAVVRLTGVMLRCPIKWLTGLSCPGCGSQRALLALLEGDVAEALMANLMTPFALAYLLLLFAAWLWPDSPRLQRWQHIATSPRALWIILALILGWMLVRNLAGI